MNENAHHTGHAQSSKEISNLPMTVCFHPVLIQVAEIHRGCVGQVGKPNVNPSSTTRDSRCHSRVLDCRHVRSNNLRSRSLQCAAFPVATAALGLVSGHGRRSSC